MKIVGTALQISNISRSPATMKSLKRSHQNDPHASNISSKVFVRSTKSGKVQKIVREVYLRQDIPCSSKLCATCLKYAPADSNGVGELHHCLYMVYEVEVLTGGIESPNSFFQNTRPVRRSSQAGTTSYPIPTRCLTAWIFSSKRAPSTMW